MKSNITVFNFSGIYEFESFYRTDKGSYFCDLTGLTGTNCMCDDTARDEIQRLIVEKNISAGGLHFIDSGNYHYMSSILTGFVEEPFSLVVLDHHPDMQRPMFGDILSCGGWVMDAAEKSVNLRDIHVIGADKGLISKLEEEDRNRAIFYDSDRAMDSLSKIEQPVYLSIDKDVLIRDELITNWDQGDMRIEELFEYVKKLMATHRIIGVDICGECSRDQEDIDFDKAVQGNDDFNRRIIELFEDNEKGTGE